MNIEDQVVSLELAKKLKEIGMEQESHWVWFDWENHTEKHMARLEVRNDLTEWQLEKEELIYPAFTVAELGEILTDIHGRWSSGTLNEPDTDDRYICEWYDRYGVEYWTCGKTEAEARAEAIIWLKGNEDTEVIK